MLSEFTESKVRFWDPSMKPKSHCTLQNWKLKKKQTNKMLSEFMENTMKFQDLSGRLKSHPAENELMDAWIAPEWSKMEGWMAFATKNLISS